jgi:hypothetical protein
MSQVFTATSQAQAHLDQGSLPSETLKLRIIGRISDFGLLIKVSPCLRPARWGYAQAGLELSKRSILLDRDLFAYFQFFHGF